MNIKDIHRQVVGFLFSHVQQRRQNRPSMFKFRGSSFSWSKVTPVSFFSDGRAEYSLHISDKIGRSVFNRSKHAELHFGKCVTTHRRKFTWLSSVVLMFTREHVAAVSFWETSACLRVLLECVGCSWVADNVKWLFQEPELSRNVPVCWRSSRPWET